MKTGTSQVILAFLVYKYINHHLYGENLSLQVICLCNSKYLDYYFHLPVPQQGDELDCGHAAQSQNLCFPWPEKPVLCEGSKGDPEDLHLKSHI